MTKEVIDAGALPNDGTSDPLRTAFDKINNNFANLFALAPTVEMVDPTQSSNSGTTAANANFSGTITINANNIYMGSQYNIVQETTVQPLGTVYNQEVINLGTAPNDGSGDPIRLAFEKINNNFNNLFALGSTVTTMTQVPVVQEPVDPTAKMLEFTQPIGPYNNQEYINVGATANDGQGDPLRVAFEKINNNFSNLFYVGTVTSTVYSVGNAPGQVIFETPANAFTQASFQIRSSDTGTPDSQEITITAQISNDSANVKYTGYGTTFFGNALTRYSMDVFDGNVRLMVDPIVDEVLLHFIAGQVTYIGDTVDGINIGLDGYIDSVMDTENDLEITTENG